MPDHRAVRADGPGHRSVREGGFTIVETVVAAAVLATALVALAQVAAVAILAAARARDTTRATLAAAQKIEELRAGPYDAAPVEATDVVDERFLRRWTIAPQPPPRAAVAIAVEVTTRGGQVAPVRLETIRARPARGDVP